jgi:hypothetical protein
MLDESRSGASYGSIIKAESRDDDLPNPELLKQPAPRGRHVGLHTALLQKPGQVVFKEARRVMSIFVREAFHATTLIARCGVPFL